MSERVNRGLSVVVLLLLLTLAVIVPMSYAEIEQQRSQIDQQQDRINQLEIKNAELEQQNAKLQAENQRFEFNLETVQDEKENLKQNNSEIQSENAHLRQENRELSSWVESIADEDAGGVKQSAGTPWGWGHVKVTEGYCVDQEFCRMTITTDDYAEFIRNNTSTDTITVEFDYGGEYGGNISIRSYRVYDGEVEIDIVHDVFIFHSQYEDESEYDSNLGINTGENIGSAGINFDSKDEEDRRSAGDSR